MNPAGKTVFVTGGAKRIGAAVVRAFADAGARVLIHCNRSRNEAAALAGSLPDARVIVYDLEHEIPPFDEPVDILVNNASVFLRDSSEISARRNRRINFEAPLLLMRQFAARNVRDDGVVINMLDQAVLSPARPGESSYLDSKRRLALATRQCALDFAPRIRVCGIAPGPVLAPEGLEHLHMAKTLESVPLKRPVDLDDLVQTILFQVRCDSLDGAIFAVDCGQHLM